MAMDLERMKTNIERVEAFENELNKETDRGCALMGASFLDQELTVLLKSKLVGSEKSLRNLLEFNGPLGTFSGKIQIAFALGLISEYATHDFGILRKIRNDFGHSPNPLNFDTETIKNRVNNLICSHYSGESKKAAKPRAIYISSIMGILREIHVNEIELPGFKEYFNESHTDENLKKFVREQAKILKELLEASDENEEIDE